MKLKILVKIVACGVCHTDEAAQYQAIPVPLPAVLGHEGAGIVEAVGSAVKEFKVGDKVGEAIITKEGNVVKIMQKYLPSFEHIETGKSLDGKM